MQDLNDDNLDALLKAHFARELNPQLGRASQAFRQTRRRWNWRTISLSGLAAAAALAAVVWLISLDRAPTLPPVARDVTPTTQPISGEYQVAWQTIDQGTVFLDEDTPVRSYLKQEIQTVRWVDPESKLTMELTVPNDELILVAMNSY